MSARPGGPPLPQRGWSLSLLTLKRLSLTHSTVYVCLLVVWLVPGLAGAEAVFGMTHGVGWIVMVVLILIALRARVVRMRSAVAVAVLGGVGPFFGSYELTREQRRRTSGEDVALQAENPLSTPVQSAR